MNMVHRPAGVWIIFFFNLFSFSVLLIGEYFIWTGTILTPVQASIFATGGFISVAIVTLNFVGSIVFFMLRKISIMLFSLALALNIGSSLIYEYQNHLWYSSPFIYSFVYVFGWGISVVIILYAMHLTKKGVLN